MESLKEFFRLDVIFRQCLPGAAFYLVLYWDGLLPDAAEQRLLNLPDSTVNLIAILIVVFLTGTFLYAIQRSLYFVVEHLRAKVVNCDCLRKKLFSGEALDTTVNRLLRLTSEKRCEQLYDWGGSAHSLYTVALAIVVAEFCQLLSGVCLYSLVAYIILVIFLLLCGFIADCRKYMAERKLYEHDMV